MERVSIQAWPSGWRLSSLARPPGSVAALGAWGALVVGCGLWGDWLNSQPGGIAINAAPLLGTWRPQLVVELALPAAAGALMLWTAPVLAVRARWRALLALSAAGALLWAVALALVEGPDGISRPLTAPQEYLTVVPEISSPGDFLAHFTERIEGYATHIRGHPPGMALILWGLAEIGLGGPWPASVMIVLAAATAAPATLIATREVAGEEAARRAAPFLVLAPAAIWIAVSADALYVAAGAWAVALLALSINRRGGRSDALAVAGGLLFGILLFLSYGLVLLAAVPLAIAARARRLRPIAIGAGCVVLVILSFLPTGFWWLDGLITVREQYLVSAANVRPYGFFLVNNIAALALALGPATAVALARLRDRRLWTPVAGGLIAVALADLSGMSKAEVERIWLPLMPWLLVAGACLWRSPPAARGWLAAQVACALAIVSLVRTPW